MTESAPLARLELGLERAKRDWGESGGVSTGRPRIQHSLFSRFHWFFTGFSKNASDLFISHFRAFLVILKDQMDFGLISADL